MFFVSVRDYMMVAHSLKGEVFGPAQQLHGATYVVDAEFQAQELDKNEIVIDIGLATQILKETLHGLTYRNLDDLPQFSGKVTTTEFLARYIHQQLASKLKGQFKGTLKITLNESHVAAAGYTWLRCKVK
jgi:6-pyruvoyltetrahydropterin/6-carboxytetrahydropterin synthase